MQEKHEISHPNHKLRLARKQQHWSQEDAAAIVGVDRKTYIRWEQGQSFPQPKLLAAVCKAFGASADALGFNSALEVALGLGVIHNAEEIVQDSIFSSEKMPFSLDSAICDKLDNAESIINLSWEAWFASRPKQALREVSRLLPNLDTMAYTLSVAVDKLRAKELCIRCHGLLGTICQDALQNDNALFHYMQAHRISEEINDGDLTAIYLCLMGDVLRLQKDPSRALRYMERARDLAASASNTTRGHILQLLAYTYGDSGQEAAFERTISEATDLLAFSGEGKDTSQKEFIPFQIYEIRGKINRDLGKPQDALTYLALAEKSLITVDAATPRWQSLLEISRAQTYCDAGDIIIGIDLACKGFIAAYQCRSPHQMNRVRKLLRKLENGPFRSHPKVQDLKNLLYETYMRMDSEDVSRSFPS